MLHTRARLVADGSPGPMESHRLGVREIFNIVFLEELCLTRSEALASAPAPPKRVFLHALFPRFGKSLLPCCCFELVPCWQ